MTYRTATDVDLKAVAERLLGPALESTLAKLDALSASVEALQLRVADFERRLAQESDRMKAARARHDADYKRALDGISRVGGRKP